MVWVKRSRFVRVAVGMLLGLAFVWALSLALVGTFPIRVWDPDLQYHVNGPGVVRWRDEGWAESRLGEHGVSGAERITEVPQPKVVFWGDSYVEALQVADSAKMQQQFNAGWTAAHPTSPLFAFGLGRSGWGVADYYLLFVPLERLVGAVRVHVIILGQLHDVWPTEYRSPSDGENSLFVSQPNYGFVRRDPPPKAQWLVKGLSVARACFVAKILEDGKKRGISLRLRPGPVPVAAAQAPPDRGTPPMRAYDFLLTELQKRTSAQLLFVYCPTLPRLESGAVSFDDPEAQVAATFAEACRHHGMGFVNLAQPFGELYREHHRFPRGFANTVPGQGHLNRDGHRIVARSVISYLETHPSAIH